MRTGDRLTVHLSLQRGTAEQLPHQLVAQLVRAIRQGVLPPGGRLPSTRDMAGMLGVSRGVVLAAYELLLAQGYVEGRPGSGTYVRRVNVEVGRKTAAGVASVPPTPTTSARAGSVPAPELPADAFPLAAWRAAWREASYRPPAGEAAHLGSPALREAVAGHLHRTRGILVDPADVAVTVGLRQACWLLFEAIAIRDGGPATVAVEQPAPAYPAVAARQSGWRVEALPVDDDGALVGRLARPAGPRCALVFAEGNHPLGTVLSAARRRDLLSWSDRTGGYIVDVCSERDGIGTGLPLPALYGGDRVAMVGALGDALVPHGLSYLVMPRVLGPVIAGLAGHDDARVDSTTQAAFTRLLRDGTLARRGARVARVYARRREQLRAVGCTLPRPARLLVGSRGPFATIRLPQQVVQPVTTQLAALGVRAAPLAGLYQVDPEVAPAGLVLDVGQLADKKVCRAVRTFESVLTLPR